MTVRRFSAYLLLFVFSVLAGCRAPSAQTPPASPPPAVTPAPAPTPDPTPTPTPDPVAAQLAAMTVEQKVGQLLITGIDGAQPGTGAQAAIRDYQVGGVILFRRNVTDGNQLASLTNSLKGLNGDYIPLFLCVDEEGGRVSRMPPELADLPSALTFGSVEDPEARLDACFALGQTLAAECAAFGFNVDFAPVMDVWSNPENTVIGDRAFGRDAETVTGAANMTALGLLDGGVIPVAKHFPGHGDTAVDSHVGLPVVDKSLAELEELELRPFRQAIDATCVFGTYGGDTAIPAVMAAHVLLTEVDPERPSSLSPAVIGGLLREELGFDGVVFTDDLTMGAISNTYGLGEAAVLAVEAGCDGLLVCGGVGQLTEARSALLEAVSSGRITEVRLDESVRRILTLKLEQNLSSAPVDPPDIDALNAAIAGCLDALA